MNKVKVQKVDPNKVYDISGMRMANIFYWISPINHAGYRNIVIDDKLNGNVLKAKITGQGRGRDYKIKGENIIKFLKAQKKHEESNKRDSSSRAKGRRSA